MALFQDATANALAAVRHVVGAASASSVLAAQEEDARRHHQRDHAQGARGGDVAGTTTFNGTAGARLRRRDELVPRGGRGDGVKGQRAMNYIVVRDAAGHCVGCGQNDGEYEPHVPAGGTTEISAVYVPVDPTPEDTRLAAIDGAIARTPSAR
jgi:hypothetical protein